MNKKKIRKSTTFGDKRSMQLSMGTHKTNATLKRAHKLLRGK